MARRDLSTVIAISVKSVRRTTEWTPTGSLFLRDRFVAALVQQDCVMDLITRFSRTRELTRRAQFRTHALQQTALLFNHLVGSAVAGDFPEILAKVVTIRGLEPVARRVG